MMRFLTPILIVIGVAISIAACSGQAAAPTTQVASSRPVSTTPSAAAETSAPATASPAAVSTGGPSGTATVDGTWAGTWTKPAGGGAITLRLEQSGDKVSGTVTMVGSACIPADTAVSGNLVGPNIVFTATGSGFQAMFGGEFVGNDMTGTLSASCSAGSATGTWQVKRS